MINEHIWKENYVFISLEKFCSPVHYIVFINFVLKKIISHCGKDLLLMIKMLNRRDFRECDLGNDIVSFFQWTFSFKNSFVTNLAQIHHKQLKGYDNIFTCILWLRDQKCNEIRKIIAWTWILSCHVMFHLKIIAFLHSWEAKFGWQLHIIAPPLHKLA